MRFFSVCSGIEAASVAWEPLGWTPVAFSEIERFPSAVLPRPSTECLWLSPRVAHALESDWGPLARGGAT